MNISHQAIEDATEWDRRIPGGGNERPD